MALKASDRLKALQERAAALAMRPAEPLSNPTSVPSRDVDLAAATSHFGASLEQLVRDRAIQRIPVRLIMPDLRPEMRQARLLPLPDQLVQHGKPVAEYYELVMELIALGESLRIRQIQPIVVFAGTSDLFAEARYLILVGQRRWTAACLVGMEALDAVVVEPPTPEERVLVQYVENEEREEFSDMERAWSLYQMKQALDDAPWEEVETRFQMSRARRQQLLRLMAFSSDQQRGVALLRLQETQARSLHSALRAGELTSVQVDHILERLHKIAAERVVAIAQDAQNAEAPVRQAARRSGIDGPTVARLVARVKREQAASPDQQPSPRWLPPLQNQVQHMSRSFQRSLDRVDTLNASDRASLREEVSQLQSLAQLLLDRIAAAQ